MKAMAASIIFVGALAIAGSASAADMALSRFIECAPLQTGAEPLRLECPIVNGEIIESQCACPTKHLMVDLNDPPSTVPPEYVSTQ